MSQIGVIVISENINVAKFIDLVKTDSKITVGKEEISQNGVRYISINKS